MKYNLEVTKENIVIFRNNCTTLNVMELDDSSKDFDSMLLLIELSLKEDSIPYSKRKLKKAIKEFRIRME